MLSRLEMLLTGKFICCRLEKSLTLYLISSPGLLARLAEHNAGEIDWSECMPVIFTRVLKMFSLPVYYNKINVGHKGVSLDSSTAAKWIIYTLGIQSWILVT